MNAKHAERSSSGPARNRCRCGHFRAAHLEVRPVPGALVGSYALLPTGACQVCGTPGCPAFAAAP